MEPEENDESLITFKKNIEELLETMNLMGTKIEQKTSTILSEIEELNNLEAAGLRLIKLCICMKGNLENIVHSLQKNISELHQNADQNSVENLFTKIHSKIIEYKTSVFVTGENNEWVKACLLHRSTQTDLLNNNTKIKTEKVYGESQIDNNSQQLNTNQENSNFIKLSEFKDTHKQSRILSLKKTRNRKNETHESETQENQDSETQDGSWIDSLKRSPTTMELWNGQHNGDKINVTDEFFNQLRREEEAEDQLLLQGSQQENEEDKWEKSTEDLNYNINQSSNNDPFIDGRTPEEDGTGICMKEYIKDESSVVIEKSMLPDSDAEPTSNLISKSSDGENENENDKVVSVDTENISTMETENRGPLKTVVTEADSNNETIKQNNLGADFINDQHKASTSKQIPSPALDQISTDDETMTQLNELLKHDNMEKSDKSIEAEALGTNTTDKPVCIGTDSQRESDSENMGSDIIEKELTLSNGSYKDPYSVETIKLGSDLEDSQSEKSNFNFTGTIEDLSSTNSTEMEKEVNPKQNTDEKCSKLEPPDKIKSNSITSLNHVPESQESSNNVKDLEIDIDNIQKNTVIDSQCSEKTIIYGLDIYEGNSNRDNTPTSITKDQSDCVVSQSSHGQEIKLNLEDSIQSSEEEASKTDKPHSTVASVNLDNSSSGLDLGMSFSDLEVSHSQEIKLITISSASGHLVNGEETLVSDHVCSDSDATDIDGDEPDETKKNEKVVSHEVIADGTHIDIVNPNKPKEVSSDKVESENTDIYICEGEPSEVHTLNNTVHENNEEASKNPESLQEDGLSQCSYRSFQFDISENFNHIGSNISKQPGDRNVSSSSNDIINGSKDLDVLIGSPTNCDDDTKSSEKKEIKQLDECHLENGRSDSSDNTNNIDDSTDRTVSSLENNTIDHSEICESIQKPVSLCSQEPIPESKVAENIAEVLEENKSDHDSGNIVEDLEMLLSDNKEANKLDESKDTVEILSDSDDGVHLDVTMEEILSERNDIEEIQVEIKEDKASGKNGDCTQVEENKSEKFKESSVGDELLELLREVQVPTHESLPEANKKYMSDNEEDVEEAANIIRRFEEESSLDITDSNLSDDESDSNLDDWKLSHSNDDDKQVNRNDDKLTFAIKLLFEKYNLKECCVKLERVKLDDCDITNLNKALSDSIERLCDLSNLIYKRKCSGDDLQVKTKRLKDIHLGASKAEDSYSQSSFSDSESESCEKLFSPILSMPMEERLDHMLANEICNVYRKVEKSDSDSTAYESDESSKNSKDTKIGVSDGEITHTDKQRKKLSREERRKKLWRNDPLLRGTFTDSESSDNSYINSDKSIKKKIITKNKYQHDSDYIISDSTTSNGDLSDSLAQNKLSIGKKVITPIKQNIPISDSSDTDSEIEFVPQKQKTPPNSLEVDEAGPSSQKGRRNIRALMSNESLAEATQRANLDEQLRIQRLQEREKAKESFSQSLSLSDALEEKDLILDYDETSMEALVKVHPLLTKRLKPHQKDGIQFMWDSCYESLERLKHDEGSGCILAHCMGLGKTYQVLTLIHTLFSNEATNTKRVLVVCPLSTVNNWKKEVKIAFKDLPHEQISVLTIADRKENSNKYDIVKKWYIRKKCVLVLGYEGFETLTNEVKLEKAGQFYKDIMLEALVDPGPDLVVCDEGHLLRNKKALKTMALNRIRTKRRIVLTGTPLQNNLLEYYHMVQFVKPNLLGNMQEYKTNFVNPITNGQYEDSTKGDIKLMMQRTHVLHKLLKKTIQRVEDTELEMYLPKMKDHAVFIQLHQVQVELYNKFSKIAGRNNTTTSNKGFLSDFAIFQYIGTHPNLLAVMDKMRNKKIKERDLITSEKDNPICNIDGWWKAILPNDAAEQIAYGNKLVVVKSIIEECEEINDKVLLFSQSLGELDLIEYFLKEVGTAKCPSWQKKIDYYRMDGTVNPEQRSEICDSFNDKENKILRLLLMSTKVGGLGLNLTAANRVIIMTVNWNPSYDTQSVFRVYRFGQKKPVFVYRLISLDTMEEKVYQRTVTKLAIAHRVVDKHQVTRHYKSIDLQELYSCTPNADQERPTPVVPEDKVLAKLILKHPFIFKYHEHQALLANRPEDNLNEMELNAAWDEFKKIKDAPKVPPQPVTVPQITNPSGPSFNLAYALSRPNKPITNTQRTSRQGGSIQDDQYYVPSQKIFNVHQNNDLLGQQHVRSGLKANTSSGNYVRKLLTNSNSFDTVGMLQNRTSGGAIDNGTSEIGDSRRPVLIPQSKTQSNKELDPLYIPLNAAANLDHSYNRVLSHTANKVLSNEKLPVSTSLVLEGNSSKKSNQKENTRRNIVRNENLPENVAIVIPDDEHVENRLKANKGSVSKNNTLTQTANVSIRKRKPEKSLNSQKDVVIKKMRDTFNTFKNTSNSINIDDDDVNTVITDTTSETGSLSNEMIKNLGLSGISVHKIMKESNANNELITIILD